MWDEDEDYDSIGLARMTEMDGNGRLGILG